MREARVAASLTRPATERHRMPLVVPEVPAYATLSKKVRRRSQCRRCSSPKFVPPCMPHRSQIYLTFHRLGECERGAGCRFSHGDDGAAYGGGGGGGGGGYSGGYQSRGRDNGGKTGTCYAFQRGECERGDSFRYSHGGEGMSNISRRRESYHLTYFSKPLISATLNYQRVADAPEASHHTAPVTAAAEHEAHQSAMRSREASAKEATVADLRTAMRRVAVEEEEEVVGSPEATTPPPAARPALATRSREVNVREAMPAVTITERRVQETLPQATTVAVTDLVAFVSLSRKESVNAVRLAASPTKPQNPPVTTQEVTRLLEIYLQRMRSITVVLSARYSRELRCAISEVGLPDRSLFF